MWNKMGEIMASKTKHSTSDFFCKTCPETQHLIVNFFVAYFRSHGLYDIILHVIYHATLQEGRI